MIPADFHYQAYSNIWLLLFLPVLIFLFVQWIGYRRRALHQFSERGLSHLLIVGKSAAGWFLLGIPIVWSLVTAALMQPEGNGRYVNAAQTILSGQPSNHELSFVLDVSSSMGVKDGNNGLSRLENAKEIADLLMEQLKDETMGLYLFTSQTDLLVPPTFDRLFAHLMLRNVALNSTDITGTDLLSTLQFLEYQLKNEALQKVKTIVLMSDGGDTLWETAQGAQKEERKQAILAEVKKILPYNVNLIVVGMGTEQGGDVPAVTYHGQPVHSVIETTLLKQIAEAARGTYLAAHDSSSAALAKNISQTITTSYQPESMAAMQHRGERGNALTFEHYFQLPLGLALLLFAIILTLTPRLRGMAILLLCLSTPLLHADDYTLAEAYAETKQYQQALQIYQNQLSQTKEPNEIALLHYNIGTLYLNMGNGDQAMREYALASSTSKASPWVIKNIYMNMALTLLTQVQEGMKNRVLPVQLDAYQLLLNKAAEDLKQAEAITCDIAHKEGYSICGPSPALQMIRKLWNQQMEELKQRQSGVQSAASNKITPVTVLEGLIAQMISKKGGVELLLKDASQFPAAVIEKQKEQFHGTSQPCRQLFWEPIILLFDEGVQDMTLSKSYSQSALNAWLKALELLNQEEKPPPVNPEQQETEHTLQSLSEMEAKDQMPISPASIQNVERPW